MLFNALRKLIGSRLGIKSILAVILLLSMISITLTTFFVSRQKSSLMDELRKRGLSLASNLAFNSQYAVLSRDNRTMQNLLAGVIKESDIQRALIVDLAGSVLADCDTLGLGHSYEPLSDLDTLQPQQWFPTKNQEIWRTITLIEIERKSAGSDEMLLFSPPENAGRVEKAASSGGSYREKLGYVVLDISLKSMNRALATGTRRAVLITLIMIVVGAMGVIYLVRSIAVPISDLADATREVARGDLDQKVPIEREDEIGVLADSFNHMIIQLKASREKIEAWNRELEAKVAERTGELEEKHEELGKAYDALKTLDKAKDDFLSLVSHELRTPLSSILLYSEMLLDGLADSDESRTEFLSTIVGNCKRLTRLINDVLDLSKIEAGRMRFKLDKLAFRALVSETLNGLRPTVESKQIEFTYIEEGPDILLWGDRDKIIQVMTNIISNAARFTPLGGRITVSLSRSGRMGRVAVSDNGKGIRQDDIPKVFDRFGQLESIDHHSEGTGLGMTISKSIIERLGGEIWIESELGKGTTVFFTLLTADRTFNNNEEISPANGIQSEESTDC
jgi:signal transduction histidine kinase